MPLGSRSQFGVTYLQQKSTSGQQGVNQIVERFAIERDINWQYRLASLIEPNSPVELGHRVILAAHLANLSYRTGKKVFWDADRKEVIGT